MGLLQESLRRYCLILREHETGSSHAETSGRRDMDLPAGETTGAKRLFEQKPKAWFVDGRLISGDQQIESLLGISAYPLEKVYFRNSLPHKNARCFCNPLMSISYKAI